jgi:threonyl-tRNA synthetase
MSKQDKLTILRNSTEHILTMAMENLYGKKVIKAMGPSTNDGFYFDFDSPKDFKISEENFPEIEKEMHRLISLDLPITAKLVSPAKTKVMFKNNPYKQEWIKEILDRGDKKIRLVTIGKQGSDNYFPNICKDQHLKSTGEIKVFKLLTVAGAYWRGSEKNQMLTRIYGTAFFNKKDLDQYLWQLEEAKKRDHKKLGPQLDLFVINEDIGKGLPLLTPKGTIIKNQILEYERQLEKQYDFQEVTTPHIAKNDLYKKTGHWQHYRDTMYAPFGIDNETYVLKPMNCPHHYMIYASQKRSYKDLPLRLSEPGVCYRYEKSGELAGLIRVRALTIDDSHILMTEDQVESEFTLCIKLVKKMFQALGLKDYWVRLSLNDPDDNAKYIADPKVWQKAGRKLQDIIKKNKLKSEVIQDQASFYGPKIDFMVKDSIGREWQMSTLQLDLFMAKRLGLVYTDKTGKAKHPVILHRGLTGSLERTLGLLIEHYAGAFPMWLAPTQVIIIPVSKKNFKYSQSVFDQLKQASIRVELDSRNATLNAKIREAQAQKIPYMLIIGDKEEKSQTVAKRDRTGKDCGQVKLKDFLKRITNEIETKAIN